MNKKVRLIFAGIIGNVIEYYDFALIGFLASIIGSLFFPSTDHFLSLLGSFGAFAAGMIARPLGAVFFGHIGDKINRKYALFGSLILMAMPTFLIGFLPTYAQIGILAPILLVLLRLVQGFSVGGEYASSIVYLVEEAPSRRQNLYGSFVSLGAKLGMTIGSAFYGFLLMSFGESWMMDWGWRVPFLASLVLAIIGLLLRNGLEDHYVSQKEDKIPFVEILRHYPHMVWHYFVIASAIWMLYYTLFIYLPTWLHEYVHIEKTLVSTLNTYSIALGVVSIPVMAYIADKVGSVKVMRISAYAIVILIVPIFYLLEIENFVLQVMAISIMTILLCAFQAPIFATLVNALKEHKYRASFTAIILGSAAGIVGGMTPALMATAVKFSKMVEIPSIFILLMAIASLHSMQKITK